MTRAPDPVHARRQQMAQACMQAFRDHASNVPLDVWCALHVGAWCARLTAGEFFAFMSAAACVQQLRQRVSI